MDTHGLSIASSTTITLLAQGRVTIPKPIRERWKVKEGDKLFLWDKEDAIIIIPQKIWEKSVRGGKN